MNNSNIHIRNVAKLTIEEKQEINNLILTNFLTSRLISYETIVYYSSDNLIIGFIGIYNINGFICLNQICTHIHYRNKGIASSLIKYISEVYKNDLLIYIDKHKNTTDYLYNFYSKIGFKEVDYLIYDKNKEYLMIKENLNKKMI